MIDHLTVHVTDVQRSIDFYTRALRPLGYVAKAHHEPTIGFGMQDGTARSDFYVSPIADGQRPVTTHIEITVTPDCVTIIPDTMPPSCWTQMATTSRPSLTGRMMMTSIRLMTTNN